MKSNTVFVVGAGASFEVGLPLGSDLKVTIGGLLKIEHDWSGRRRSGDLEILRCLQRWPNQETASLLEKCREIADAIHLFSSIDDLIDSRSDDRQFAELGKVAIVKTILESEKQSAIYIDIENNKKHPDFENKQRQRNLSDSYLPRLWSIITAGTKRDDLDDIFNGLSFVIFNYDRCLEHFLYHAIQMAYNVSGEIAAKLISQVKIIHPYGTAGKLPWQSGAQAHADFGAVEVDLLSLAPNIKTYTERVEKSDLLVELKNTIQCADRIVFLGMAFHEQNMELLSLEGRDVTGALGVLGTAYGLSKSDRSIVEKLITSALGRRTSTWLSLENMSCAKLLDENGRLLTHSHLGDLPL